MQREDYDAGEQKIPAFPAGKQERKEEYVMDINAILEAIDGAVWGVPLIVLIIACVLIYLWGRKHKAVNG